MTPAVLQYRALEHWDGRLPLYSAGQLPLLTFDAAKLGALGNEGARQKALQQLLEETDANKAPKTAPEPPPPATTPPN